MARLLLFHVCVGVIHYCRPASRRFYLRFSTASKHRAVQAVQTVRSANGCDVGWRRARFRCPPGDWVCQIGWSGEIRAKLKTTPPVINHLPVAGMQANPPRPRAPGFIRRDKAWHPEKWAQPSTRQDISGPNVTDSLSTRGLHSKGIKEMENVYLYSFFFYFCWNSDSLSLKIGLLGRPMTRSCCGTAHMVICGCMSLTHSPSVSLSLSPSHTSRLRRWRGESSGWKWLMPLLSILASGAHLPRWDQDRYGTCFRD